MHAWEHTQVNVNRRLNKKENVTSFRMAIMKAKIKKQNRDRDWNNREIIEHNLSWPTSSPSTTDFFSCHNVSNRYLLIILPKNYVCFFLIALLVSNKTTITAWGILHTFLTVMHNVLFSLAFPGNCCLLLWLPSGIRIICFINHKSIASKIFLQSSKQKFYVVKWLLTS